MWWETPDPEEQRQEDELQREMQRAWERYRQAAQDYRILRAEYGDLRDHSDGALAIRKAATSEQIALQSYHRALRAFGDFVMRRNRKEDKGK